MIKPKGIVFDMDGVLRIGENPIPKANDIIQIMVKNNVPGMISTNECRYTDKKLREELSNMGIFIPNNWIIYTSAMAVRDYLSKKIKKNSSRDYTIGIIGEDGLKKAINSLKKLKNCSITIKPVNDNSYKVLIIGAVNKIKMKDLERGLQWINSGAKIITTCCDTTDPSSKGDFNLGMPSHILHLLKYNARSINQYSLGKPHPIFRDKIIKEFKNIPMKDLLFVGDTLYTDIKLAEESNMMSCLVLSGNSKLETLSKYIIEPDMVVNSVWDLKDLIE